MEIGTIDEAVQEIRKDFRDVLVQKEGLIMELILSLNPVGLKALSMCSGKFEWQILEENLMEEFMDFVVDSLC